MRRFYLIFSKRQALPVQFMSWSHYVELMMLDNIYEINYYIEITINQKLSYRKLREKIKSKEYQRLSDETKNKLINKEEIDVSSYIKNPIYINTFNNDKENISENTFYKKGNQWLPNL